MWNIYFFTDLGDIASTSIESIEKPSNKEIKEKLFILSEQIIKIEKV